MPHLLRIYTFFPIPLFHWFGFLLFFSFFESALEKPALCPEEFNRP